MPQASSTLTNWAEEKFGSLDDFGPSKFLRDKGYKLTKAYNWIKPHPDHEVTKDESFAINFLFYEWDYGGLKNND